MALHCTPPAFGPALAQWFARPSTGDAAHINLDFELIPHSDTLDLPNTLLKTKSLGPNGSFDIANGLISGHYHRESRTGAIRAKGAEAFLVHSSAVIAKGSGFLFVGPSEAGKTTAAMNSTAHHILGDEMTLVLPEDESILLEGTPFNGTFKEKKPGKAPLRAVFLLKQASRHRISTMDKAEAASLIAAEVVPPVGLDQIPGSETIPAMVDMAAGILDRVPVFRLELLPDPGFWAVIDDHFKLGLQ